MPTVSNYLKYANIQMAAEAFLVDDDGEPLTDDALIRALVRGNGHSSKFTRLQAEEFADPVKGWTVVDQRANTETGFSGTLFRNNQTGELVISLRSTEFIDDHARDNKATNALEVAGKGWAFGQIDDMEQWYAELKADPDKLGDKAFSVTGYSLGGHLATTFNLLRSEEEEYPGALQQVVTFNGAGVGKITDGTLTEVMDEFRTLRNSPAAIDEALDDPDVEEAVREIRTQLTHGTWTIGEAKAHIQTYKMPPDQSMLTGDRLLVYQALIRMEAVINTANRAPTIQSGSTDPDAPAHPADVPVAEIVQATFDYQMAVQLAGKRTEAFSLFDGAAKTVGEREFASVSFGNQYDVMGAGSPSAVANSQLHYGADVKVFIEDQPVVRGGMARDVFTELLIYQDLRLLVDGYAYKDFGDTHSLVLIVDSLTVQNTLLQLLPEAQRASADTTQTLETILHKASYLKAENGALFNGDYQGKADGAVLENVASALGGLHAGQFPRRLRSRVSVGSMGGDNSVLKGCAVGCEAHASNEQEWRQVA